MRRRGAWIAAVLALCVGAAALLVTTGNGSRQRLTDRAERVLVISLPYTSWSDLEVAGLPNLNRLMARSAIASLTTRTIGSTDLINGYLTVSAGTRATGGSVATNGTAFNTDEEFGRDRAGDVFQRQTGQAVDGGIVHLGLASILDANEEENLDAVIGALGDALHRGGYARAVVANGDGESPISAFPEYQRMAAVALMGTDGRLPAGRVDAGLLIDDPASPFGRRLDVPKVLDAFESVWKDHSVVLVEASDLVRAARYQPFAVKGQRRLLYKEALRASDRLIGRLLEDVDPTRDAVVVVSPAPSVLGQALTVVSVRAPGTEPGLLRSPSLRRPGFVPIIDVAPMILDLVGVHRPPELRGRPITVASTSRTAAERRAFLVDEIEAGEFRDEVLNPVIITFVVLQTALALGAVLVLTGRVGAAARARVRFGALLVLAFVPVVYLARLAPFHDVKLAYPVFLAVASLGLATLYERLGRRHELDSSIIALAAIAVLMVGDVLLGAQLQLDSAFGYTPTAGVRISGFGNISYAALTAAAVLLAGLVAHRVSGRRGVQIAIGILVFALFADAAPFWGADVGGVLSIIPAFGITAALLLGIRVRAKLRTVLVCLAAVFIGLVIAAAIDLSRTEEQQTHLGRFIEQVRDQGFSTVTNTISHKLSQSVGTITGIWGLMLPGVLAFLAYLKFVSGRLTGLVQRIPELRAALVGFTILAVLGSLVNDSGINIPAMMLGVLNGVLVVLLVRRDATDADTPRASAGTARGVR